MRKVDTFWKGKVKAYFMFFVNSIPCWHFSFLTCRDWNSVCHQNFENANANSLSRAASELKITYFDHCTLISQNIEKHGCFQVCFVVLLLTALINSSLVLTGVKNAVKLQCQMFCLTNNFKKERFCVCCIDDIFGKYNRRKSEYKTSPDPLTRKSNFMFLWWFF